MAGTAGFARIHVTHGDRFLVGTGRNNLVVAVVALIAAPQVDFVTEHNWFNFFLGWEIIFD